MSDFEVFEGKPEGIPSNDPGRRMGKSPAGDRNLEGFDPMYSQDTQFKPNNVTISGTGSRNEAGNTHVKRPPRASKGYPYVLD